MKKLKVDVPVDLMKLANQVDQKRKDEIKAAEKKELLRVGCRARETAERRRLGRKDAKKIFKWIEAFQGSREGKRLIAVGMKFNYQEGIFFFDGRVEEEAWRGLGVSPHGIWWIRNGCGACEEYVATPEDLASQIEPAILKEAVKTFEDGRVWECIKNRMLD